MLVMGAILLTQLGASLAKQLFSDVGPGGTVFLRLAFGAVILSALSRPRLRGHGRRGALLIVVFGLTFAGMNGAFYASIDRIPLGVAVTIEFIGPLAVGLLGSRRRSTSSGSHWRRPASCCSATASARAQTSGVSRWRCSRACSGAPTSCSPGAWAGGSTTEPGWPWRLIVAGGRRGATRYRAGRPRPPRPVVLAIWLVVAVVSSALPYSFELEALRGCGRRPSAS
jgi:inner membrane transporter RhtA